MALLSIPGIPEIPNMTGPVLLTVFLIGLGLVAVTSASREHYQQRQFINKNRAIISMAVSKSDHVGLPDLIEARGNASRGIKHVYGLNNSFTTTSNEFRLAFTKSVRRQLNAVNYTDLVAAARGVIRDKLARQRQLQRDSSVPVALLVQNLTMKLALKVLFGDHVDVLRLDDERVDILTREINRLWLAQKNDDLAHVPAFADQHVLLENLTQLLQVDPTKCRVHDAQSMKELVPGNPSAENPMNRIIPAYEAIWRVVLLGYLDCQHHVYFARESQRLRDEVFDPALSALTSFLDCPTEKPAQNRHLANPYNASRPFHAFDIADEALRLYPSTKSIYRQSGLWLEMKRMVRERTLRINWHFKLRANVEKMHRLTKGVWLDRDCVDSLGNVIQVQQFYPRRWLLPRSELAERAYVPFAFLPTSCPAGSTLFGKRVVAILIGALAEALSGFQVADTELLEDSLKEPVPLPSGRENLDRWRIYFPQERIQDTSNDNSTVEPDTIVKHDTAFAEAGTNNCENGSDCKINADNNHPSLSGHDTADDGNNTNLASDPTSRPEGGSQYQTNQNHSDSATNAYETMNNGSNTTLAGTLPGDFESGNQYQTSQCNSNLNSSSHDTIGAVFSYGNSGDQQ